MQRVHPHKRQGDSLRSFPIYRPLRDPPSKAKCSLPVPGSGAVRLKTTHSSGWCVIQPEPRVWQSMPRQEGTIC